MAERNSEHAIRESTLASRYIRVSPVMRPQPPTPSRSLRAWAADMHAYAPLYAFFAMETSVQEFIAASGVGAGLYNLGNTCFMNAILQAIFYCSQFMDVINKHTCCKFSPY